MGRTATIDTNNKKYTGLPMRNYKIISSYSTPMKYGNVARLPCINLH